MEQEAGHVATELSGKNLSIQLMFTNLNLYQMYVVGWDNTGKGKPYRSLARKGYTVYLNQTGLTVIEQQGTQEAGELEQREGLCSRNRDGYR